MKVCPHCKELYKPDPRQLSIFNLESSNDLEFYHGKGCDECFHSGYSGRTGIFEIMKVDELLRELVVGKVSDAEIKEKAIQQGMNTLKMSGLKKIRRGETTIEETLRVIL